MKRFSLAALTLTLLPSALIAQAQQTHPEAAAVMQVVEQFFASINNGDGALLASLEVEGAQILNIREEVLGEYAFTSRGWFEVDNFNGSRNLTERYWDEQLLISDYLAVFWAPYDFHIDGEFSHCGIDVLNLIKQDGEWKIGNAMWTVERSGCGESPLGALGGQPAQ